MTTGNQPTRREFMKSAGTAALSAAMAPAALAEAQRKRWNILFLMTDQQQAWTVDPKSPCLTPNLNRLGERSMRFTRMHTVNAICSPTRATLYTGLLPSVHGMVDCTHTVEDYRARFRAELPMWSRELKKAGYQTAHYGKWHVERSNRLENFGFDDYVLLASDEFQAYRKRLLKGKEPRVVKQLAAEQKGYKPFPIYRVFDQPEEATEPHFLYSKGIDFIRRAARNPQDPWCCVISTIEPHDPYDVTKAMYDAYKDVPVSLPASFNDPMTDRPNIYRRDQTVWRDLTREDWVDTIRCYWGGCSLLDRQVGRVLKALEETGQRDNTIVFYTTDHGDQMGAHGMLLKGVPPFEETYTIPLTVHWPGVTDPGRTCDRHVNYCDFAPTILEMAGAPPLAKTQGRSFAPLLRGETPADWPDGSFAEFHGQRFFYTQRIVWDGDWKYVFNGFDFDELYNLRDDPHEMHNLINEARHRERAEHLASLMWKTIKEIGDHNMFNAQYGMFRWAPVGPEGA